MRAARCASVLAALLCLAPCLAVGQEAAAPTVPYVSMLSAESAGGQVKLTWQDAPDAGGACLVYRYPQAVTARNLQDAQLVARVPAGTEYAVDAPPAGTAWFYAVMVEDSSKRLYPVVLPFRNVTSSPVTVQPEGAEAPTDARVTDIRAALSADGLGAEVSFRTSDARRDLLLFWGTSRMTRPEDLLGSTSRLTIDAGQTRFTVPVLAGVDYHFAVLDAEAWKLGRARLAAGENVTAAPFQVPVGPGTAGFVTAPALRPFPLPALDVGVGVQTGAALDAAAPLALPAGRGVSAETERAIAAILAGLGTPPPALRGQQILPAEGTPPVDEEQKGLQAIVKGPFTGGDLPEAERQLRNFLGLNRRREVEGRARFYLGQVLYLQDRPREAFLEFLVCEDVLYAEASAWKAACLERLRLR
jgi:hypothetical protein